MAAKRSINLVKNITLCLVLCTVVFVRGEKCSVYIGALRAKEKVEKLAGSGYVSISCVVV